MQQRTRLRKHSRAGVLSHQDYNSLSAFTKIDDQETYYKLQAKASDILKRVTMNFYVHNDFENDYPQRKEAYIKALAAQIEYFYETGSTTTEGLNSAPQTQQIGRTSLSHASKFNPGGENEKKSIVSDDVYLYLSGTGLLGRGIG